MDKADWVAIFAILGLAGMAVCLGAIGMSIFIALAG